MRWSEHRWLGLILALYLLVGTGYAIVTPDWQVPDEPAHYNYVAYLAQTVRLPVLCPGDYPAAYLDEIKAAHFPVDMSIEPIRYEFWQPPLYYLLAAPIFRLAGGALLPLRLFSLLLGSGVVIAGYALARRVWPSIPWLPVAAAAVVAFVPMHLSVLASVNNDVLAELLIAVVFWRIVAGLGRPPSSLRFLLVTGVILGLGLLTKATVYYVALPLVVVSVVLSGGSWRTWWRQWLALLGPAFLVTLPWYVRNTAVYGWPDFLGKLNHDRVVVGQLRTADYLAQTGWPGYLKEFLITTFHSFWGQFGWMAVPMDRRAYLMSALLVMLAGAGLLVWLRQSRAKSSRCRPAASTGSRLWVMLGVWITCTLVGYVYYNITFVQFQGRYLFPAMIPLAIVLVQGWRYGLSRKGWPAGLVSVVVVSGGDLLALGIDKWSLVTGGAATFGLLIRSRLPEGWDEWLPLLPAGSIVLLAVYSVPAFLIPYL